MLNKIYYKHNKLNFGGLGRKLTRASIMIWLERMNIGLIDKLIPLNV
jgi:hypothetical protein